MAGTDGGQALGVREYGRVFWRRKWVVVGITLLAVAVAVGLDSLKAPIYQSSARLLLTSQSSTTSSLYSTGSTGKGSVDVPTQIQVLQSQPVTREVHKLLGGHAPASVTAAAVGQTKVITITASSHDPKLNAKTANAYAEAYISVTRQQFLSQELANEVQLTNEINTLQAAMSTLNTEIGLSGITGKSAKAGAAQAQYDGDQTRLNSLQTQLSTIQQAVASTPGAGTVLAKAVPSSAPVSPKTKKDALIAFAVGLVIGLGAALVLEYMDDRVRTRADLERALGTRPALGLVPKVNDWRDRKEPLLVSEQRPKSPPAEAYRSLRTAIRFMSLDRPLRVLQVTSPTAAEGKTTTSANLAVSIAQTGQRVALVSCDLRKPRLHEFFGLDVGPGFTSVLVGESRLDQALREVEGVENLFVLPSGPVPPNPSELLSSIKTQQLFRNLAEDFDLVIVDSPPVLPVSDASVIAAWADGVLLVTASRVSTRRDTRRSIEVLERVNAVVIGAVLNVAAQTDSYAYYRYGYGYEYAPYAAADHEGAKVGNGSHGTNGANGAGKDAAANGAAKAPEATNGSRGAKPGGGAKKAGADPSRLE
jgi:polysaccharide biosynthesis transport protein